MRVYSRVRECSVLYCEGLTFLSSLKSLQKMEQDDECQRVIRNVYSLSLSHNAVSE